MRSWQKRSSFWYYVLDSYADDFGATCGILDSAQNGSNNRNKISSSDSEIGNLLVRVEELFGSKFEG